MYSAYWIARSPRATRTLALVVPIPTVLVDMSVEMVPLWEWMLEESFALLVAKESRDSEEGRSRMVLKRCMLQALRGLFLLRGTSIRVNMNDSESQYLAHLRCVGIGSRTSC